MTPQIDQLGRRILATCLNQPAAVPLAITSTNAEMYSGVNRALFMAIKALHRSGQPITMDTVLNASKIPADTIMGYMLEDTGDVEDLAANIKNNVLLELITSKMSDLDREQNVGKAFFRIVNEVSSLAVMSNNSSGTMSEAMERAAHNIQVRRDSNVPILGMATKHKKFNAMTEGFLPGLSIIMGEPGMGKTTVALDFMQDQAKRGRRVGFVSLEMTDERIAVSALADDKLFDRRKLRKGHLNDDEMEEVNMAHTQPWTDYIHLDVFPGNQLDDVMGSIYKLRGLGCEIIFVDHIHHMKDPSTKLNPERMFAEIATVLSDAAAQHGFPIVALAQMNSNNSKRQDKRPQASDLKYGGVIRETAELIIGVYRPVVHGEEADELGAPYPDGYMEMIIRKNREAGETGIIHMRKIKGGIFEEGSEELNPPEENKIILPTTGSMSIDGEELPF